MKSLINFHFSTSVPRTGVPVAHIRSPEIMSSDAISISDTSSSIGKNSFFRQDSIIGLDETNLTHYVDRKGFLLTDRFSALDEALYFKHKLNETIYVDANQSSDIVIVDSLGSQVSSDLYTYECANNTIYHNLPSDKIYFVIYPKADSSNSVLESRHRELLESAPAFDEAELDNFNACGLNADSDSYLIDELDGRPHFFRITLPRPGTYKLKYTDNGLLKLKSLNKKQSEPWFIEIQNSVVLTNHISKSEFLRYTVSEFNLQSFYPFYPIKMFSKIDIDGNNQTILDTKVNDIVLTNKTPVSIMIYNDNNSLVKALTTDVDKQGSLISNIYWETDGIVSVGKSSGRIELYRALRKGERAEVSLFHKSNSYTYTGWNFNPVYNTDALTKKIAILVKPSLTNCTSSISHVVINEDETLDDASDLNIKSWVDASTKTLTQLKAQWIYDPSDLSLNDNNYFILGIVSVHTPISPGDIDVEDVRRRGGGIIDAYIEQALKIAPEAHNNFDIGYFDGPPVPLAGAILLYLPQTITNFYTEDQIREKASKYAAAGTYIVIRYY